jgi:hypothetical protein
MAAARQLMLGVARLAVVIAVALSALAQQSTIPRPFESGEALLRVVTELVELIESKYGCDFAIDRTPRLDGPEAVVWYTVDGKCDAAVAELMARGLALRIVFVSQSIPRRRNDNLTLLNEVIE